MSSGTWIYTSPERQGSHRLVLVEHNSGNFTAQRQRFNPDGTSLPLSMGDVHKGDTLRKAQDWLLERHRNLAAKGFQLTQISGVFSRKLELTVEAAISRHRALHRSRRPEPLHAQLVQAAVG